MTIMVSCDKEDAKLLDEIDSYLIENGTEWIYQSTTIKKVYESEAFNKIIDIDSIISTYSVFVDKDIVLNDSLVVKQIKISEGNFINYVYLLIDSEGVKVYGYKNHGFDEITMFEMPWLTVKLPLFENSSWISQYPQGLNSSTITKEVIGSDELEIKNTSFKCFKVRIISDSVSYKDAEMLEWISQQGKIKEQIEFEAKTLTSFDNTNSHIQLTYITSLVELKIKE